MVGLGGIEPPTDTGALAIRSGCLLPFGLVGGPFLHVRQDMPGGAPGRQAWLGDVLPRTLQPHLEIEDEGIAPSPELWLPRCHQVCSLESSVCPECRGTRSRRQQDPDMICVGHCFLTSSPARASEDAVAAFAACRLSACSGRSRAAPSLSRLCRNQTGVPARRGHTGNLTIRAS